MVINLLGRVHMDAMDDPFAAADRELDKAPLGQVADAVIVDMHCEATSEKMAMGHYCDGRASLVVGTHTHVPTADCQILPGGTAYQTDAGACADYDSRHRQREGRAPAALHDTQDQRRSLHPAHGPATICGVYVETDDRTGLAVRVEPIRVGGRLSQAIPIV
jgi:calcineurin-like phosphoesterase